MVLKNISLLYEHNKIFDYKTLELYQHQKDIFNIFAKNAIFPSLSFIVRQQVPENINTNRLVAGLQCHIHLCFETYWIEFGKSSFHMKRKIGFAFGCNSQDNIRLNYNAVRSYTTTKNGRKIPNHSDGTNVELMICDV